MSWQNLLSYGKIYCFKAIFRLKVKDKHFSMQKGKSVNVANEEDQMDLSVGNYFKDAYVGCKRATRVLRHL